MTDRRPLSSRDIPFFQGIARALSRSGISPNAISVSSMFFAGAAGTAFWWTTQRPDQARWAWLAGAILVQLRLIANMLDGMVAIEGGKASPVGELYNEVPDRISDSAILIGVGLSAGGNLLLGMGAALAAMLTAYVRAVCKAAGAPQDFSGPMAKPHRMALVTALGVAGCLAPPEWRLATPVLWVILTGSLLTALRRLLHGARDLRKGA